MNIKYVIGTILVVGLLAAVGFYVFTEPEGELGRTDFILKEGNGEGARPEKESTAQEYKKFTLASVGNSKVAGDGSIVLKSDGSSLSVRLAEAPKLPVGENYEVYIVQKENSSPVFVTTMLTAPPVNKTDKFIGGSMGNTDWFKAKKVIITRRAEKGAKPGKIVAEAVIPDQGTDY